MLDKLLHAGLLFDFYGALLTDKQQKCFEMHYLSDLSLAEIAEEFGVTRQAVHDILRRAEQILEEYEAKLHLVERHRYEKQAIGEVYGLIRTLPPEVLDLEPVQSALAKLGTLVE